MIFFIKRHHYVQIHLIFCDIQPSRCATAGLAVSLAFEMLQDMGSWAEPWTPSKTTVASMSTTQMRFPAPNDPGSVLFPKKN